MTQHQALTLAQRHADESRQIVYVVWSPEDWDKTGEHYHVATEHEMDGFYNSAIGMAAIEPLTDGMGK